MNALPFVTLATVLVFCSCAPSGDKAGGTAEPPPSGAAQQPGRVVDVEIIVGAKPGLDKLCLGNVPATTIFVASQKEVYHCVGKKLREHSEHGKSSDMEATIVRLSAGDQVRWYSNTNAFTVTSVVKHPTLGPQNPAAPEMPFGKDFIAKPASEQRTGIVPDVPGEKIEQRYKVTFNIVGVGPVDPDLICSM